MRFCTRRQRSRSAIAVNAIPDTVGTRIDIENDRVAEIPGVPLPSRALLSEKHCTTCCPTPLTGTWAVAAGYHLAAPPSTAHEIPATPDGPAAAVAVTYCVPAVDGASAGPVKATVGCWLSIRIVLV